MVEHVGGMALIGGSDSGANESSQVLNPFTPLAFLPPSLANEMTLANYVVACSLSVLIWDILHHLVDDFYLAFKKRFRWPTAVYFLSRISTLLFFVVKMVQLNTPLNNCGVIEWVVCGFFVVAHSATSFLFYIRVCAVYGMQRSIVLFFGFTWLIVVAGAAATFVSQEGVYIGPTQICTSRLRNQFIVATSVTDLFNDSLVFLAILYRLSVTNLPSDEPSQKFSVWDPVRRLTALQGFTKGFWQDSQIYYFIAVIMNLATMITFFTLHRPADSPFRVVLITPSATVMNIMACRVFRNVQFGRHSQQLFTPDLTGPMEFRCGDEVVERRDSAPLDGQLSRSTRRLTLRPPQIFDAGSEEKGLGHLDGIAVTKVVEFTRD